MLNREFMLTLDCDWAPDFILEEVFLSILRSSAKATVFVTNPSKVIDAYRDCGSLEFGWHPNLHPQSTQGGNLDEIIDYLENIVPAAKSIRTHDLFQSTSFFRRLVEMCPHIRCDSSLYLPGQTHLQPFFLPLSTGIKLLRIPFAWEDDLHLYTNPDPGFTLEQVRTQGICVVNFHPIHIYLNSCLMSVYEGLKELGPMQDLAPKDLKDRIHKGEGTATLFQQSLESLNFTKTLSEYAEEWDRDD